jgi:CMP-N-acetylneuraminic acid synthetase
MEELYKKEQFRERCYAYIMPEERSVDIDTELDFVMAEYLLNREKVE